MIKTIMQQIIGTPLWVWAVLAYLLIIGIRATHTRIVSLPRLFIIPAILIALKYRTFLTGTHLGYYAIFICMGAIIGYIIGVRAPIKVFKDSKTVELPATYATLIILISFFAIKYAFGYLHATQPEVAAQYAVLDVSLSALLSGFLIGKFFGYIRQFYR